eukprot:scaffold706_cov418-Prasinococcus_capsulatus_cf.AAC.9
MSIHGRSADSLSRSLGSVPEKAPFAFVRTMSESSRGLPCSPFHVLKREQSCYCHRPGCAAPAADLPEQRGG